MNADRRNALLRQALALTILLAAFIAAVALVIAPIMGVTVETHDEVVGARERLSSLKAKRVDLTALESELKLETSRTSAAPPVFDVATSSAGWEQIEARLRSIASANEAEFVDIRTLRLEEERGLHAIRTEGTVRIPSGRLADFLAAVEGSAPALFIERVRLTTQRVTAAPADQAHLEMTITLRALAAINAAQQPARR